MNGDEATLTGSARDGGGSTHSFALTAADHGEPGKGHDTLHLQLLDTGYDKAGVLGGGNIQIHKG